MPDSIQHIFGDDHSRSTIGTLIACAILIHLAFFPGYVARKRRHPRGPVISIGSALIVPIGLALWFTATELSTIAFLLSLWFAYFLAWAYRSRPTSSAVANSEIAQRLGAMTQHSRDEDPPPLPAESPALADFEISGIDRESGAPIKTIVSAASSADAKSQAAADGTVITEIRALAPAPD